MLMIGIRQFFTRQNFAPYGINKVNSFIYIVPCCFMIVTIEAVQTITIAGKYS